MERAELDDEWPIYWCNQCNTPFMTGTNAIECAKLDVKIRASQKNLASKKKLIDQANLDFALATR